ncbi:MULTISPECIES: c-type cytochrome [Sulfitobacter]|uniref:C-type cytochrome n=2 Tax=Sulfitobacter TaxID=60136 RepID=A0AAE3B7Y4_9RHOB|nr:MULTISPECIES: c-type cytochrome [Sulfitobacter]MBM1691373.1 c-type cytochrome [Sulfitobacter geojensis]MBM1695439.1 c-type cytochrome [Sulfitobacter geojensis]MBM1707627.1 c-type cytochrome [Sulfitobacter geojensis]MBM1711689.1 c-type cytochrome [Sulfitobacter geojensis]MBM1715752.1 c-type cytochrome [Sulfitobacter geojensis]
MKSVFFTTLALAFLGMPVFADGHATGDANAGEKVFKRCKACHSIIDTSGDVIQKGGAVGPNLYGLYNRIAGTDPVFSDKYGSSIVEAGESGLAWSETDFMSYVADPKKFLAVYLDDKQAKSKMGFKLKKVDDARDIWAYLVSVGPEVVE